MLLIYYIHFIYVYLSFSFMFHACITLEVDTGKNCMLPKVLSLYETVISICMTQTGRYNDPNGIYVIDPNGALISVNCML